MSCAFAGCPFRPIFSPAATIYYIHLYVQESFSTKSSITFKFHSFSAMCHNSTFETSSSSMLLICTFDSFVSYPLLQNPKDIKAELQQASRDPIISDLLWPDLPAAPVLGSQPAPAHPPQGAAAAA